MWAKDTYQPLADFFELSREERVTPRGEDRSEPHWNNMVQFARRKLKDRGCLVSAKHGLWRLTEYGVRNARQISTGHFQTNVFPNDIVGECIEGAQQQVQVNRYERNGAARMACIEKYGYCCTVCDFDFEKAYGERGRLFIHVHHLIPLSEIRGSYAVNPIEDLRPICPNCHSMAHRTNPPCSLEELKAMLKQSNQALQQTRSARS